MFIASGVCTPQECEFGRRSGMGACSQGRYGEQRHISPTGNLCYLTFKSSLFYGKNHITWHVCPRKGQIQQIGDALFQGLPVRQGAVGRGLAQSLQGAAREEQTVPSGIEGSRSGSQGSACRPHPARYAGDRFQSAEQVHLTLRLHRCAEIRQTRFRRLNGTVTLSTLTLFINLPPFHPPS